MQPTKYGKCERDDRDRWNKWDGLWTEGNKNETCSMKCRLKEMTRNINNEVWIDAEVMKHEQWSR